MTDKLKCPFCGTELNDYPDKTTGVRMAVCRNPNCKYDGWHFPLEIWQALIDGKKAQRQLRTAKDRCIKTIKTKEREITNYLNGINVRSKEIETLHKQLQKAQDVLIGIGKILLLDSDKPSVLTLKGKKEIKRIITSITKQEE